MNPALRICGRDINVRGRLLRIATIEGDKYIFPDDPQSLVEGLRKARERIDLFTFMQRLPETIRKYDYPMELDNLRRSPHYTFDDWWTKVLGFKGRNKAKQAEKKGVKLREIPFDDVLIQGIWRIYNETPVRQGKKLCALRHARGTGPPLRFVLSREQCFHRSFFRRSLIGFAKLTDRRVPHPGRIDAHRLHGSTSGQSPHQCSHCSGSEILR